MDCWVERAAFASNSFRTSRNLINCFKNRSLSPKIFLLQHFILLSWIIYLLDFQFRVERAWNGANDASKTAETWKALNPEKFTLEIEHITSYKLFSPYIFLKSSHRSLMKLKAKNRPSGLLATWLITRDASCLRMPEVELTLISSSLKRAC